MYAHTYVCMYIHMYVHTHVCAYIGITYTYVCAYTLHTNNISNDRHTVHDSMYI